MKGMGGYTADIRSWTFLWMGFLWLVFMMNSSAQENRIIGQNSLEAASKAKKDYTIRVGVDEVRLDAVVVDYKGRQITDLTADDFEIYQDGQLQEITSCTYISDHQTKPGIKILRPTDTEAVPPASTPMLTRESVRRTIAFVVDNLSMDFAEVHNARLSLRKYVETQMQPGDLVAVMTTCGGNAGSMMFTSDKRHLLAIINKIRWYTNRRMTQTLPQFAALHYFIRALQDMPGRKALFVMSPQVFTPADNSAGLNYLADTALRAGVVIHTLDMAGLLVGLTRYDGRPLDGEISVSSGSFDPRSGSDEVFESIAVQPASTAAGRDVTQAKQREGAIGEIGYREIPLSLKTGGLFLTGNNFFLDGIGAANEELKGYYMLSYIPPTDTFEPNNRGIYRRVKIISKRPGSQVRHRDGFFGVPETAVSPAEPRNLLVEAMFSPFQYNDLTVNLASGYINDPQEEYLLRAWLHLDGKNLGILDEKGEGRFISFETLAVTTDINGTIQDSHDMSFKIPIDNEIFDIAWIREHGIKFSLSFPPKKPGGYYVRVAVKDQVSGNIGSAYKYVEIPNLKKNHLSLSDIFLIDRDEYSPQIHSATTAESLIQPNHFQPVTSRIPALRIYRPGERLVFKAEIYNAKTKKGKVPDLESQFILYQEGKEVFRSETQAVDLGGLRDYKRIPIQKGMLLSKTIEPGNYILQLQVKDKQAEERHSHAAKALDFEIATDR
jgi:VWFA-related protein